MDISISEGYSDATHIFGICHIRQDGLDRFGRTVGKELPEGGRSLHRENMTKAEAIAYLQEWADDGGNVDGFRIVASRRPLWETCEGGARANFKPFEPRE